ncbi:hypothetical protein DIS24_g9388 [Lasiodiplodia hormozganensis]|uniref:Uncharacterized protein n=1 Tax=Lasiodiplodia hormozganensis TaxID=869390 RepID=A0AA39XUC3_9PEZI|nr:hypothetical protein DIS24_g9388 [Lasiodiplodia hormozganensis]
MAPQLLNQMLHPSRSEAKAMRRLKAWGNGFDDTLTTFRGRIIPRQSDHLRYNRTREYWVLPAGSWEVMMIKAKLKRPKKPRRRSGGGSGGRPQLFIKRKRKYVPDKKWFERVAEDQRRDMLKPVAERVQRAHLYHVLDNNVRSNTTPCVELGQTFFPWARLPPDIQDAIIAFAWGKPDELRLEWLGGDEKRFHARRLHHGESHGHDAGVRFSRRQPHHRQRHSIIAAPPLTPLSTLLSVNRAFSTRALRTLHGLTTLHFTSAADLFRFLETIHATYLPLLGQLVLSTTDLDAFGALTPRHAVASRGLRSMMLNSGGDEGVGYEDCCNDGEKHGHGHRHHRAPHRGKSLQRVDEDEERPRRRDRCGGGGCGHAHHKRRSRSISSSDSDSSSSADEDCCSDGCCGHGDGHDHHATDTSSSFFFAESESSLHKRRGRSGQKKRQIAHNYSGAAAAAKGHAHHGGRHQHGGGGGCCGDDHGHSHSHDNTHAAVKHSGSSTDDDATTEETQWWRRRGRQLPAWLRRWWSNKKNKTLPLHRFWTKGKKVLPRLHGGKRKKKAGSNNHKHDHSHHKDKRQDAEQEEEDERRRSLQVGSATQPKDVLTGLKSFVLRIEGGEEGGGEGRRRHFRWMRVEDDEQRAGSSKDTHPRWTNCGGRVVCHVRGEYASETGLRAVWGAEWLVRALRETMAPRMCDVRIEGLLPDGEAVVDEGARGLVVAAGGSQQRENRKGKERAVEAAVSPQEEEPSSRRNAFAEQENSSGDEEWQSAVSSLSLAKPVERSTVIRNTRKQTGTYLEKQAGGAQGIPWRDLMLPNDYKRKFRLELL